MTIPPPAYEPDPMTQDPDLVVQILEGYPCDHAKMCCSYHRHHVTPHRSCR